MLLRAYAVTDDRMCSCEEEKRESHAVSLSIDIFIVQKHTHSFSPWRILFLEHLIYREIKMVCFLLMFSHYSVQFSSVHSTLLSCTPSFRLRIIKDLYSILYIQCAVCVSENHCFSSIHIKNKFDVSMFYIKSSD